MRSLILVRANTQAHVSVVVNKIACYALNLMLCFICLSRFLQAMEQGNENPFMQPPISSDFKLFVPEIEIKPLNNGFNEDQPPEEKLSENSKPGNPDNNKYKGMDDIKDQKDIKDAEYIDAILKTLSLKGRIKFDTYLLTSVVFRMTGKKLIAYLKKGAEVAAEYDTKPKP